MINQVLERRLGKKGTRFTPSDRAFLAALLHHLPRDVLRRMRLLVRSGTAQRWHRDLLARRHATAPPPAGPGAQADRAPCARFALGMFKIDRLSAELAPGTPKVTTHE